MISVKLLFIFSLPRRARESLSSYTDWASGTEITAFGREESLGKYRIWRDPACRGRKWLSDRAQNWSDRQQVELYTCSSASRVPSVKKRCIWKGVFFLAFLSEDDKNVKSDTELTRMYKEENDENSSTLLSPRKRRRSSSDSEDELPKSPVKKFRKLYMSPNKAQFLDSLKDADQEVSHQSPSKGGEEPTPESPPEAPRPSPKRNRFAVLSEEKREKFNINASKTIVKSR